MFKANNIVFIVNFEHVSHLFLVFLLLTLNMYLPAGGTLLNEPAGGTLLNEP